MTGGWKARKTKSRFPSLPTALGNRWRDSHIPTAPAAPYIRWFQMEARPSDLDQQIRAAIEQKMRIAQEQAVGRRPFSFAHAAFR